MFTDYVGMLDHVFRKPVEQLVGFKKADVFRSSRVVRRDPLGLFEPTISILGIHVMAPSAKKSA
jgi:hypothetical protein